MPALSKASQLTSVKPKRKKTELSLPMLKKKVQRAVNAYIRERDKDLPCISCQKGKVQEAGHFWAQGSSGFLRYHFDNINGQCTACNRWKHGNLLEYRLNLIEKIGVERLDYLDDNRLVVKKWSREELESILEGLK